MADKFSETVSDVAPSPQGPDNTVSVASEGGAAGWLTVFGAFWGLFATFGLLNAFGTFEAYYIQNQLAHYTQSDISWIGSLQLCIFFITVLYDGAIIDVSCSHFSSLYRVHQWGSCMTRTVLGVSSSWGQSSTPLAP
jgi:hypothetical protein